LAKQAGKLLRQKLDKHIDKALEGHGYSGSHLSAGSNGLAGLY
jgi:hypothetical protein